MSKCREEFEKWFSEKNCVGSTNLVGAIWQAAWNARGKVDAEICRNRIGPLDTAFDVEARSCAEAIEQENEKC